MMIKILECQNLNEKKNKIKEFKRVTQALVYFICVLENFAIKEKIADNH